MTDSTTTSRARIAPSWKVALAVIIGYSLITPGLMVVSGVDYDDLLYSSHNVLHGVVIPLAAGAIFLILVQAFLRWDHVFSDPGRLPMNKLLWAPVVVMVVGGLIRLTGIPAGVSFEHIGLILLGGVLVGFTEETVFRGFLLRSLRAGPRPEIQIALIVSLAFGLFHLTNVFTGSPLGGVIFQVILASITGFALYLARRGTGLLVAGMVLHGFWDVSTFLVQSKPDVQTVGTGIAFGLMLANLVLVVIVMIWAWRNQPTLKLTESGTLEGT